MFAIPRRTLTAAALALAALPAAAQWYAGAAVGESRASFRDASTADQLIDLGFLDASTGADRSGTMYRLYGGWRFHRYFSMELGYTDLGKYRMRTTVSPPGTLDTSIRTEGADLSLVGMYPVWDRLQVLGRVGAYAARTRASFGGTGSVEVIDGAGSQSRHSTNAVYGAGLVYDFNPRWSVRAEWSRYEKLGTALTGGEFDASVWSAALQWRF